MSVESAPTSIESKVTPHFAVENGTPDYISALRRLVRKGILSDTVPALVCVDLERFRHNLVSLKTAFAREAKGIDVFHTMACKTFPLMKLLKIARSVGFGLECASMNEVTHALEAGFTADKIVFDGFKSASDLESSIDLGVFVFCDCLEEVDVIASILERKSPRTLEKFGCGIRINPQLSGASIGTTFTASKRSHFGVAINDYKDRILEYFERYDWLTGLHCHVGSQGCPLQLIADGAKTIFDLAEDINEMTSRKKGKQQVTFLDVGGGVSVNYWSDETNPTFQDYARTLSQKVPEMFTGKYRLATENGRSLNAKCAWLASKIEYTKTAGWHNIAKTHVGANMFVRTAYQPDNWQLRVSVHQKDGSLKPHEHLEEWDIAGPLCFSGDLIVKNRKLPPIHRGDILVVHDIGAYTYSMYSLYNSRSPPFILGYSKGLGFEELYVPPTSKALLKMFWCTPGSEHGNWGHHTHDNRHMAKL